MRMRSGIKLNLLERATKSISLWSMKIAFKGMSDLDKLETRREAAQRIQKLKATNNNEDLKIAELWIEFYSWTSTYGDE